MTSQLILGNGTGIALASDSAVTISRSRTYETAEKIFELPAPHRLAVMHSGNGLYYRIPVEVVVKEWIGSLSDESERSVRDYRDDFRSWIGNRSDRWECAHNRDAAAWNSLRRHVTRLVRLVKQKLNRAEEEESLADIALERIRQANGNLTREYEQILSSTTAESIMEHWWEPDTLLESPRPGLWEEVCNILGDIPRSATIDEAVRTFLRLIVEKGVEFPAGSWFTLNFVGYGANDLLPTVARLDLGGSMKETLWHYSPEPSFTEPQGVSHALIVTAAQDDVISLLLHGYNRELSRAATSEAIDNLYASVISKPPDQDPEGQVVPGGGRLFLDVLATAEKGDGFKSPKVEVIEAVEDAFAALTDERWIGRTLDTVAVMPLLDLAAAAQALVAVQALTLDIRGALPSVGGHIEVATITRNEGFKWVSRGPNG